MTEARRKRQAQLRFGKGKGAADWIPAHCTRPVNCVGLVRKVGKVSRLVQLRYSDGSTQRWPLHALSAAAAVVADAAAPSCDALFQAAAKACRLGEGGERSMSEACEPDCLTALQAVGPCPGPQYDALKQLVASCKAAKAEL